LGFDRSKYQVSALEEEIPFRLSSSYQPTGDQPNAINALTAAISAGKERAVLLGVTGSGKTFTVANLVQNLQRPTLVIAPNKTLAAQLYSEFKELFPENAVRYFVSYYDYYQPEAYVPASDTYIEKDAAINDEIDKLRHSATKALIERRDVIVVASVSCIYGLGDPETYFEMMLYVERGAKAPREAILKKLVSLQYQRSDDDFSTGTFRVRGDTIDIFPASEGEKAYRIELFAEEVEELIEIDGLTGKKLRNLEKICIYPASHFVTGREDVNRAAEAILAELEVRLKELEVAGKLLEAQRLEQRTRYDVELLREMGFCPGIENYSRHLAGRAPGEPPTTLLDYFPEDKLIVIDESHVSLPQIGGMYRGDRSRKQTLVDFGFRLPSALDNRPLKYEEFVARAPQILYASATPGQLEISEAGETIVEQIIRPTGLVDPAVKITPATNQVDDFLAEVRNVVARGERALLTTVTKRMAEDLAEFYRQQGVKTRYIHADVNTLERVQLIRGLRQGEFDLLIGINLLREGLDLPEVSLVGVMDADKEGFLRSNTSLIQTIGRAARHINGRVILYADVITESIKRAIQETDRRRTIQQDYNQKHGIVPRSVSRSVDDELVAGDVAQLVESGVVNLEELAKMDITGIRTKIEGLRNEMRTLAKNKQFEEAAEIRDRILALEKLILKL
jgi:excinuclease ABC subunit B